MTDTGDLAARVALGKRFDSSEADAVFLVEKRGGGYLRLSATAFELVRRRLAGESAAETAADLARHGQHVDVDQIATATETAERRLRELDEAPPPPNGFLVRRELLRARLVRVLVAPLTVLFRAPVMIPLAVCTLGLLLALWPDLSVVSRSGGDFWIGFGLALVGLGVHELGHAAACARFGATPSAIGFGVYVVFPSFYSDVTGAWTLPRWQRVLVDVGGVYLQSVVCLAYVLLYDATQWPPLLVAIALTIGTITLNMNPVLKFDGYWFIADALGVSNLGAQWRRLWIWIAARARGRETPKLPWPSWVLAGLVAYVVVSTVLLAVLATRLGPAMLHAVLALPRAAERFAGAVSSGRPLGSLVAFLGLCHAALLATIFALMFARLLRWIWARTVSFTQRLQRGRTRGRPRA